jgi:indolepyruvate decarboxylase
MHHQYQDAPLEQVLSRLTNAARVLPRRTALALRDAIVPAAEPAPGDGAVTIAGVIDALNVFVDEHPDVPLVTDTGDCLFAAVEIRTNECIAPAYYATMGFAVPAALGLQVATARRPLVLVGDGAFQMTGPEIAHASRYGCSPLVVVLNNGSWEMLQAFVPAARYNATVPWPFARLADLWGASGFEVRTHGQLRSALARAWTEGRPALIEVFLERGDISPVLARFVKAFRRG